MGEREKLADALAELLPNTASDHQHALMLTNAQCEMIVAALRAHAQGSLEQARAYVDRAIASYDGDPADNQFQRGFLAALEVVRDEAFAPTSTDGKGGVDDGRPACGQGDEWGRNP